MAAKDNVWNINVDGIPCKIEFKKNKVSVNGQEPVKLNKLPRSGNVWEYNYSIPVEGKEAVLHIRQFGAPILSYEGVDCSTGEKFVPMVVPGWVWVFVVLHAIDFGLLIGGAIGGAWQVLIIALMVTIASKQKMSTVARVMSCLGIWLGSTALQFVFAMFILSLV